MNKTIRNISLASALAATSVAVNAGETTDEVEFDIDTKIENNVSTESNSLEIGANINNEHAFLFLDWFNNVIKLSPKPATQTPM